MSKNEKDMGMLSHEQWNLLRFDMNWAYGHKSKAEGVYTVPHLYHSSDWVLWVRRGRVTARKRGKGIVAVTGEWLSLPAGNTSIVFDTNTEFISIGFFVSWAGQGNLISLLQKKMWKTTTNALLEEKALHLCREIWQREKVQYFLYEKEISQDAHFDFRWLFYDWLRIWLRGAREQGAGWHYVQDMDERLVPAANYLKVMPGNQRLNISGLAQETGLSCRQFYRSFQKQYGMPPKAYREQYKHRQAVEELQTTQKEIKEIAALFGYNSSQFSVWIKKGTGKTPSQLRKGA